MIYQVFEFNITFYFIHILYKIALCLCFLINKMKNIICFSQVKNPHPAPWSHKAHIGHKYSCDMKWS